MELNKDLILKKIAELKIIREKAYAPYSNFKVACIVID